MTLNSGISKPNSSLLSRDCRCLDDRKPMDRVKHRVNSCVRIALTPCCYEVKQSNVCGVIDNPIRTVHVFPVFAATTCNVFCAWSEDTRECGRHCSIFHYVFASVVGRSRPKYQWSTHSWKNSSHPRASGYSQIRAPRSAVVAGPRYASPAHEEKNSGKERTKACRSDMVASRPPNVRVERAAARPGQRAAGAKSSARLRRARSNLSRTAPTHS